jgi:hypothetical protein
MKKVLIGVAALPFLAGVAGAGQPLTDQQLDRVTAGFSATSIADAQGVVGESGIIFTAGATLAEVQPFATATLDEASSTLWKSLAAAQSASVASTFSPAKIPGLSGPVGP